MSASRIESPIVDDWHSCRVSMGSSRAEGGDSGEIIEVLDIGGEA